MSRTKTPPAQRPIGRHQVERHSLPRLRHRGELTPNPVERERSAQQGLNQLHGLRLRHQGLGLTIQRVGAVKTIGVINPSVLATVGDVGETPTMVMVMVGEMIIIMTMIAEMG